jgi:3-phenylpropionate/trans-cinnamate dioxygenase ferredoxin component
LAELTVGLLSELPPGEHTIVDADPIPIGVYNCGGELFAIEDRCSHDDGPLCEGMWDQSDCRVVCPRHGATFDLRTGAALTLPAYLPVRVFPVRVEEGVVKVDVD